MAHEQLAYGVANKKNADIKNLAEQVEMAQSRVTQHEAIVKSLQTKSELFADNLSLATANKAGALVNFNLARETRGGVGSLAKNFKLASRQTELATGVAADVSQKMASLIGKLIFSVEIINKLSQLINKQRALNPLLPETLVSFMATATRDANNAITLTLTALQSCYVAESTLLESTGVINQADRQAQILSEQVSQGQNPSSDQMSINLKRKGDGLVRLLQQAYENAVAAYDSALARNDSVVEQLAYAQTQLALANMHLSSSQAGLKAATAAAYAA